MIMAFELTMPHRASWNGHWGGEKDRHIIIRTARSASDKKRMEELDGEEFHHTWNDGWGAAVSCRIVDTQEARRLRKVNRGFCGYDWMVRSIWNNGEIAYED